MTKTRESFEKIRSKRSKLSLRLRLILMVSGEIEVSVLLAYGIAELVNFAYSEKDVVPLLFLLVVISLFIGIIVTVFMSKYFFDPIKQLGKAMEKIADGDFNIQLDTKSSAQEIQEVFTGFNLMTNELKATEVLQTDFVSNVSHEIKTPINAIEGYSMLLQSGENLSPEQKKYVDKIIFNTGRLSNLVGNILLLSKIENQSIETNKSVFRLDEQIRQALLAQEEKWTIKDIDFDVDLIKAEYNGNENLMLHVWENLISNAVKFSPQGGLIRIKLIESDSKFIFTIEDEGDGFDKTTEKRIFDKFYQGDSSHKEDGNGLGLALVKRIITITKGDISAENRSSGGAKFTVTLYK